jgi:hypothetical protein
MLLLPQLSAGITALRYHTQLRTIFKSLPVMVGKGWEKPVSFLCSHVLNWPLNREPQIMKQSPYWLPMSTWPTTAWETEVACDWSQCFMSKCTLLQMYLITNYIHSWSLYGFFMLQSPTQTLGVHLFLKYDCVQGIPLNHTPLIPRYKGLELSQRVAVIIIPNFFGGL